MDRNLWWILIVIAVVYVLFIYPTLPVCCS